MEKSTSQQYFFSPSKYKSPSPSLPEVETVQRLSNYLTQKTGKLETLRIEKMICEIRSLQDRPNISENSKKIFKNYIPLYKRLDEVVKSRYELKKTLQMQAEVNKKSDFKANCTFRTSSKSPTRTPEEFVEQTVNWENRRIQQQEFLKKRKDEEEEMELTLKPYLSSKTLNLSSYRSLTPVFERLYEVKGKEKRKDLEFRPCISPVSSRMVGKREGAVYERLYSLRKLRNDEPGC